MGTDHPSTPADADRARPRSFESTSDCDHEVGFEAFFREYVAYVWRVARALVGDFLADDVTQEVFLVVQARVATFDGPSVRAWLYGITRNVARNAVRAHTRHDRRRRHAATPTPGVAAGDLEAAMLMQRFLDRLPPTQREAFMLKELEELTAAEIAIATGVPLQTVYSRVRAARAELERFRIELKDQGGAG